MNKSETLANLATALAAVQGELRPAEQNAKNPFFKSTYADLGSVVSAARALMSTNGLSVAQFPGETVEGRASLTTILMHSSGEWLEHELTMPLAKADPQGYGSAITYARRYALAAVLGIVTGDDDDANIASQSTSNGRQDSRGDAAPQAQAQRKRPAPPMPTAAMVKQFHKLGSDYYGDAWDDKRPELVGYITGKRHDGPRVTSSKELYRAEMQELINGLNDKLAERKEADNG